MSTNPRQYVPRLPRHTVAAAERIFIEVVRYDAPAAPAITAALIDFSRQGLRFQTVEPFGLEQRVQIRMAAGDDFRWVEDATIRWSNHESPDGAIYGCVFDGSIEWEVLGELLLRGVLAMD